MSVPVNPAFLNVTESTLGLIDDGLSPQRLAEMVSKTDERLLGVLNGLEVKQLKRVLGSDIELASLFARIAADVESSQGDITPEEAKKNRYVVTVTVEIEAVDETEAVDEIESLLQGYEPETAKVMSEGKGGD